MRWLSCLFLFFSFLTVAQVPDSAKNVPVVTHYDVKYTPRFEEGSLQATAVLRVKNTGTSPVATVPVLLYRLFDVMEVREGGAPAKFTQQVVKYSDEPTLQVLAATVQLSNPLTAGEERELTITYAGHLLGYSEVMAYVRDRVDADYTLLRNDSLAYPIVSEPSFADFIRALQTPFTYSVQTVVPPGFEVACGNSTVERTPSGGTATVSCRSLAPNDRIDLAIAKFVMAEDANERLKIYSLPEQAARAKEILAEMKRTIAFYDAYLGPMPSYSGYTVIEIPEGWGSQASRGYILQTAAAFADPARVSELYHEIAHTWNAKPAPEIQRSRFFDEAFASYFSFLAQRRFAGEQAYIASLQRSRDRFLENVKRNPRSGSAPIVDYGKYELGGNSYTKGAWSLYVLHQAVGDDAFRKCMRRLLEEQQPITFQRYLEILHTATGKDMKRYADEWFYSAKSTELLQSGANVEEIAARYK